jgi:hypothetical protein
VALLPTAVLALAGATAPGPHAVLVGVVAAP